MKIYYSASHRGFFDPAIHTLPEDAVPVTKRRHAQLVKEQEKGGEIVPGPDGKPLIRKITADDQRTRLAVMVDREARRRIIAVSPIWRQINDQRAPSQAGAARFARIDAIREASGQIKATLAAMNATQLAAFDAASSPLWPEFDPE